MDHFRSECRVLTRSLLALVIFYPNIVRVSGKASLCGSITIQTWSTRPSFFAWFILNPILASVIELDWEGHFESNFLWVSMLASVDLFQPHFVCVWVSLSLRESFRTKLRMDDQGALDWSLWTPIRYARQSWPVEMCWNPAAFVCDHVCLRGSYSIRTSCAWQRQCKSKHDTRDRALMHNPFWIEYLYAWTSLCMWIRLLVWIYLNPTFVGVWSCQLAWFVFIPNLVCVIKLSRMGQFKSKLASQT